MFWFHDLMSISLRQVFRQRKRYAGVVLAILMGTAGLIAILSMGRDIKKNVNNDLDLLGGATIIRLYFEEVSSEQDRISLPQFFRTGTADAIRDLPGVAEVSERAVRMGAVTTMQKNKYAYTLLAVDNYFWRANGLAADAGELFGKEAVEGREKVCVLGAGLAEEIYGKESPLGKLLPIERELYHVMGVVGGISLGERSRFAFIPFTTGRDRVAGIKFPDRLYVHCLTWDDVEKVAAAIPGIVADKQPTDRLRVDVGKEQLKRVTSIAWWIEFFIYLSLVVTFVLAGLGIWNSMMSAVQSRTREIGVKKAIGAEDKDIFAQFLSEALCLSIGSAILGIALGLGAVQIASRMIHTQPSQHMLILSTLLSLLFSAVLGLLGGLYPSVRASRMEVVSAIRYE